MFSPGLALKWEQFCEGFDVRKTKIWTGIKKSFILTSFGWGNNLYIFLKWEFDVSIFKIENSLFLEFNSIFKMTKKILHSWD